MSPRVLSLGNLVEPVVKLLRQGLSPRALAKAMAAGCTTGTSPLIGTTTTTGTGIALLFRLNVVACLSANYAVYPLQIALVLPFAKLGQHLTGWHNLPLSPSQIKALLQEQGFGALETLASTLANATLAWLLCTPFIFLAAYFFSHRLVLRWQRQHHAKAQPPSRSEPLS